MTEQQLWKHTPEKVGRAQEGDTSAYEALYHENVGRVYALCLRMTRNTAQAEDLTQEAFIRAWQKLNTFKGDSQFSTWLHRLTVNVVLTSIKRQKKRYEKEFAVEGVQEIDSPIRNTTPGTKMDIEKAIATLPFQTKQVFVLYQIEGHTHAEIADMLGIATGTTKAQLHRARKMLREVLA